MNRYNFTFSLFFCFWVMASAACHSLLACHISGRMTIINKLDKALTVDYYVNHEGVNNVHAGSFKLNEHRRRGHQHNLCWQVDVYDNHLNLDRLDFTVGGKKLTCKVKVSTDDWEKDGRVFDCTNGDIIKFSGKCTDRKLRHECVLSIEQSVKKIKNGVSE